MTSFPFSSRPSPSNNSRLAGRLATTKRRFGEAGRYAVAAVHTRFEAVEWFVWDAETPDHDGFATVVRQEATEAEAVAGL